MQNYTYDGWKESDFTAIADYSADIASASLDLDNAVGSGGGSLTPDDVLALVMRLETATKRLREIAHGYY